MTRAKLANGAWIDYRGQRWHLERRQDDKIEWRCGATLTHQIFTDAELQKQIRLGKVKLFDGVGREPKLGRRRASTASANPARSISRRPSAS